MVSSKRKGNSFELKIYDVLKPVIPDLERLSGSGNRVFDKGDLRSLQRHLLIECKFHKDIYDSELEHWFIKLTNEANKQKLEPILIYKENNKDAKVRYLSNTFPITLPFQAWVKEMFM